MPVVSPAPAVVSTTALPSTTVAALLLCATSRLASLGLSRPTTDDILVGTGASRSRAYELKARVEALLPDIARPVGRPPRSRPAPAPVDLTTRMLDYVLDNPGCVTGPHGRRRYSDGLRHYVLELATLPPAAGM